MDDVGGVRCLESIDHGVEDLRQSRDWDRAVLLNAVGQRLAWEELHEKIGLARVELAEVLDIDDAVVAESKAALAEQRRADAEVSEDHLSKPNDKATGLVDTAGSPELKPDAGDTVPSRQNVQPSKDPWVAEPGQAKDPRVGPDAGGWSRSTYLGVGYTTLTIGYAIPILAIYAACEFGPGCQDNQVGFGLCSCHRHPARVGRDSRPQQHRSGFRHRGT